MELSIIICTFNRAENLSECFKHLDSQINVGDLQWEVVLVDNNSNDNTHTTVEELAKIFAFNIRYIFEPEQGLSFARNRGISETTSRYIIFIDDDIRPVPEWLSSIYSTFRNNDCDAVGGRILVESPETLPSWITPDMYGFLGQQDFGDIPHQMDGKKEFPFGGNMAFQRRVIEKIGCFDTGMGRKGGTDNRDGLFKGEETDFFHRLADSGGTIYYEPRATVRHKILPYQLKKRFFRILHYNAGILKAIKDNQKIDRSIFGIPLFLFPQLFRSILKYITLLITVGPSNAFRQQMNIGYFIGMIAGYYKKSS